MDKIVHRDQATEAQGSTVTTKTHIFKNGLKIGDNLGYKLLPEELVHLPLVTIWEMKKTPVNITADHVIVIVENHVTINTAYPVDDPVHLIMTITSQ